MMSIWLIMDVAREWETILKLSNVENLEKFKHDNFYDKVEENSNDYYLAELPEAAHDELVTKISRKIENYV